MDTRLWLDRASGPTKRFYGLYIGDERDRSVDWGVVDVRRLRRSLLLKCPYCNVPVTAVTPTPAFLDVPGWMQRVVPTVIVLAKRAIVNRAEASLDEVASSPPPTYWHVECALAATLENIAGANTDVTKLVAIDRLLDAHEDWLWSAMLNNDKVDARQIIEGLDGLAGQWARVAAARIRARARETTANTTLSTLRMRIASFIDVVQPAFHREFLAAIQLDSADDVYAIAKEGGVADEDLLRSAIQDGKYDAATALVDVIRKPLSPETIRLAILMNAPHAFTEYLYANASDDD